MNAFILITELQSYLVFIPVLSARQYEAVLLQMVRSSFDYKIKWLVRKSSKMAGICHWNNLHLEIRFSYLVNEDIQEPLCLICEKKLATHTCTQEKWKDIWKYLLTSFVSLGNFSPFTGWLIHLCMPFLSILGKTGPASSWVGQTRS